MRTVPKQAVPGLRSKSSYGHTTPMTHRAVHVGTQQTVGDTHPQQLTEGSFRAQPHAGSPGGDSRSSSASLCEAEALKQGGRSSSLGLRCQLYPSAAGEPLAVPPNLRRPPPVWGCPSLTGWGLTEETPHTHPSQGGRTHSGSHCRQQGPKMIMHVAGKDRWHHAQAGQLRNQGQVLHYQNTPRGSSCEFQRRRKDE